MFFYNYFKKVLKLQIVSMISNILKFAKTYKLSLTSKKLKNDIKIYRQSFDYQLTNDLKSNTNWIINSNDFIYYVYLNELVKNVSKLYIVKQIIEYLKTNAKNNSKKLIIFSFVSLMCFIVFLIYARFFYHWLSNVLIYVV